MKSDKLAKPLGPYCAGRIVRMADNSRLAYTSGFIGQDPETSKLVEGGIQAETRQAFTNFKNLITDMGFTTSHVINCSVYLANIADFAAVNEVYKEVFADPDAYPSRKCFAVKELPVGALIEFDAVLFKPAPRK